MRIKHRVLPLAVLLALLGAVLTGCSGQGGPAQGGAPGPAEVGVVTLAPRSVRIERELPGRASPFRVAEIRPQVGGIVQKRLFAEGGEVKAGELLYQINPEVYQAAFDSAKATLAKAEANLMTLKLKAERYKELVAINGVSKQEHDDAQAAWLQAQADVAAAKAALESARINLAYSRITSPIAGVIGKSSVTEGALLAVGQAAPLATVQQLDPIYVDISQSSAELLRLKREFGQQAGKAGIPVQIVLEDGSTHAQPGKLEFTDVTVDAGTGAVSLRVLVPNPKHDLLPGMFVRARLQQAEVKDALLVPQQAVSRTPKGEATVMVVGSGDKAEARVVEASRTVGNQWLVSKGLAAGDRVIVEGLQKVQPGMPVKPSAANTLPAVPADVSGASSPASAPSAASAASASAVK
ncbi:efflux RND transporter periplasmic adaptor subunit [Chitinilyticum litopenaei]|uniref:efflux RND transporter periplasmic adaptor subunit n=1 Tax=Chitinilyticum litopenaei TaxID=1121276 RepID=UPI00049008E2|nr:efflux RND transporter periplasmic adaptor subunit [Chitinilyticum litopenaei]